MSYADLLALKKRLEKDLDRERASLHILTSTTVSTNRIESVIDDLCKKLDKVKVDMKKLEDDYFQI